VSTVLVDWLGRGGIAQCTEAWALVLGEAGQRIEVVTRTGRELRGGAIPVVGAPVRRNRVAQHAAVAQAAARRVRELRPTTVVVQNYIVPPLETPVYRAAREVGARVVLVVHDHRLHTWKAGFRAGLAARLRDADVVIAHTHFVAEGVRRFARGTEPVVVPLPVPLGMLRHERPARGPWGAANDSSLVCGQFGVLGRRYKGSDLMGQLAAVSSPGWSFVAAGVGAPTDVEGVAGIDEFLEPGALVGLVEATDVTIAPYRFATQSAVVVLAQTLGSVPIASAVGGIPEQIDDGVDGVLVAPGAPVDAWRDALVGLADDEHRKAMAAAGEARAWRDHEAFVHAIRELTT
jgi:glycosyltransferase involved in cell wall biosynthesis